MTTIDCTTCTDTDCPKHGSDSGSCEDWTNLETDTDVRAAFDAMLGLDPRMERFILPAPETFKPHGKMRVYIAGRMSGCETDYLANVARMLETWRKLVESGYAPYCPATDLLLGLVSPGGIDVHTYRDLSMEWLRASDAVFISNPDDITPGQEAEIAEAERLDIPVAYTVEELARVWA